MNSLRVGFLAPPWLIPAVAYGGIERAVDSLCRGLVEQGVHVRLWSATNSTCPVPRSGIIECSEDADGWHSAPDELNHVLAGYEWLMKEKVDIVHDVSFAGPLIAPALFNVPVVTTNYLPFTPPQREKGHSFPDLSRIYRAMAEGGRTRILAISEAQALDAEGYRPETILLGLDIDQIPFGTGEGDEKGPYACFYARMSPEKGAKEAILAAREAGMRIKVATRMSERHEFEYFREEVEHLVDGDQVELVEQLTPQEGYEFLKKAAALLHPIAWPDTFGTSTVESIATGTPVIAFRLGAVGEVIQEGVTGAACDSFDEMVTALKNYRSFSREACRKRAEERFSNERVVRDHIALYRSMLENPR